MWQTLHWWHPAICDFCISTAHISTKTILRIPGHRSVSKKFVPRAYFDVRWMRKNRVHRFRQQAVFMSGSILGRKYGSVARRTLISEGLYKISRIFSGSFLDRAFVSWQITRVIRRPKDNKLHMLQFAVPPTPSLRPMEADGFIVYFAGFFPHLLRDTIWRMKTPVSESSRFIFRVVEKNGSLCRKGRALFYILSDLWAITHTSHWCALPIYF